MVYVSQNQTFASVSVCTDELTLLNGRMAEKGVDVGTERKIESWKRDIMAEIQLMQSQIQLHRSDDMGGLQSSSVLRDINET